MSLQNTAQKLAAYGRNGDTMLVHMTPGEVGGLQALAKAQGGSLSINPKTGLPEAFFLAALLPTLLGAIAPTLGAAATGAGLTGLGSFLGSKMGAAGLGALAGALMNRKNPLMGAISGGFGGYGGAGIGQALGSQGAQITAHQAGLQAANLTPEMFASGATSPDAMAQYANAFQAANVAPTTGMAALQNLGTGARNVFEPGMMTNLGQALPTTTSKIAAASPFIQAAATPQQVKFPNLTEESNYAGPYRPTDRQVRFQDPDEPRTSREFSYFDTINPYPGYYGVAAGGQVKRMAGGGLAALAAGGELLEDGSFVIDARTVSEIGNGSSEAGQELLAQLGGRPVKGPGDGVSDSIPATIEGEQDAAVARDEVIFDPESVAAIGEGDMEEGARRLYAMMDQVAKARKTADRGEDSGAGLTALSAAGVV